jgi:hypothetical protein
MQTHVHHTSDYTSAETSQERLIPVGSIVVETPPDHFASSPWLASSFLTWFLNGYIKLEVSLLINIMKTLADAATDA